jgi:hypothetical protein
MRQLEVSSNWLTLDPDSRRYRGWKGDDMTRIFHTLGTKTVHEYAIILMDSQDE